MSSDKKVTFVLTSCNRFDLLKLTLQSFIEYNTYPIERYIFIEDSEKIKQLEKTIALFPSIKNKALLLHNPKNLGQLKSIDRAYSYVETPYVFHCEEDWCFYKKGFIENSMAILDADTKIINVWLRERSELINCPIEEPSLLLSGFKVYKFKKRDDDFAFTFNPTLKRYSDYRLIGGYSKPEYLEGIEESISSFYETRGFYAVIFDSGYVRHEGWHRRVLNMSKERSKIQKETDALFKKVKAHIYKVLGIWGKGRIYKNN